MCVVCEGRSRREGSGRGYLIGIEIEIGLGLGVGIGVGVGRMGLFWLEVEGCRRTEGKERGPERLRYDHVKTSMRNVNDGKPNVLV